MFTFPYQFLVDSIGIISVIVMLWDPSMLQFLLLVTKKNLKVSLSSQQI